MEQEAFDVTMRSNDAAKAMRSMLDTEKDIEDRAEFKWEGNQLLVCNFNYLFTKVLSTQNIS